MPNNFSVSGQKIADTVSINGQIRLDDTENFDFKQLSVFTQHQPGKSHPLKSEMELTIQLYRGAAFSVCLPDGMTSGSIQFRPESGKRRNVMSVIEFSGSETVRESLMGGLSPGRWKVFYVDDNDQILKSQQLDLRRGQIFREKCQ